MTGMSFLLNNNLLPYEGGWLKQPLRLIVQWELWDMVRRVYGRKKIDLEKMTPQEREFYAECERWLRD